MPIELLPPPTPSTPPPPGDDIRVLELGEWEQIRPMFKANGGDLPDPNTSTIIGAIRGGKIIAFLVLQLKLHAQPLWIEDGHQAIMGALVNKAEETILAKVGPMWVYTFTPAGTLTRLAQTMGMQMEPWVVMSKLVTPFIPVKPVLDIAEEQQLSMPLEAAPEAEGEETIQ